MPADDAATRGHGPAPPAATGLPPIGYITSRFPVLTETFVLFEILALERYGYDVRFYPLLRGRAPVAHPESLEIAGRARYLPFLSLSILGSQVRTVLRSPGRYAGTLWAVLQGTWRSRRFLLGAIAIFPKSVHIARLMQEEGVAHVHCHFATHPAVAGLIVRRLTGIPFSFTAQGSDLHVDRTMLCQKIAEARFVVAISHFNREVIRDACGEAAARRVEVLHSGVDVEFFRPGETRPGEPGSLHILCVGRLDEGKGQTYLVEACRLLREEGVEFEAELIGEGERRQALARQIEEAGLEGRVRLEGPAPRSEIAARMRAADVVVAPSVPTAEGKKEGIPVVLMEAMACGRPTVASHLAGIPELVEDGRTGFLVPPGDPPALAAALGRLARDPALRRAFGRAGRERVLREFDAFANGARLGDLIRAGLRADGP